MDVITRLIINGEAFDYIEGICGENEIPCSICALKDVCDEFALEEGYPPCEYTGKEEEVTGSFIKQKDTDLHPSTSTKHDAVNHPKHYKGENGIECIDAMEAAFGKEEVSIFCKCNAFKYLFRNRIQQQGESIQKAAWYMDKYKQLVEEELWVSCVENDAYEVSNKGNVRLKGSDAIRKPVFAKNGYATIMTTNQGKPILYYVHRLVANAFIPNPNNLPQVNHKDHNRANNSVGNLEWCDAKYNVQDAMGEVVYAYDENKSLIAKFNSLRDAENHFNISHSSIKRYWIDKNRMCGNVYFYSHPLNEDTRESSDANKEKEIQDLEKAKWYINDRIEQLKSSKKNENGN